MVSPQRPRSSLVTQAVRWLGRLPVTRPALIGAYGAVAHGAARAFAALPDIRSVQLSGSLLNPSSVAPGASDIDLVLVADLPTPEIELHFRAQVKRILRVVNRAGPVLYNLEYFAFDELEHYRAFGNGWAMGLGRTWRTLAGDPLQASTLYVRDANELRNEAFFQAGLRWRKSACPLLGSDESAPDWLLLRSAERTLACVLAEYLGADRYRKSLGMLLERARRTPELAATLAEIENGPRNTAVSLDALLAASLAVLDHFARECTQGWHAPWPIAVAAEALPRSSTRTDVALRLLGHGFQSVYRIARGPGAIGARLVAVAPESDAATDTVARAQRAFGELGIGAAFGEWPLVLTPCLWRALALFEPGPFLAASVAAGQYEVFGRELPPPPAPPSEELMNLLRVRAVELFYRPRGRLLRLTKSDARSRFDADMHLAPALGHALRTGTLPSTPLPPLAASNADEFTQISALRGWIEVQKRSLTPELERRRVR
ncbi:MAG TPA: hypothetical protein VK524_22460 [Polyangiaceae bacterium]|nr:hypothetical protein [Polyangiaceae bacterium]